MKKLLLYPLSLIVILIIAFLLLPLHARRMVLYNFANIDDYHIFNNRPVKTGTPQPWVLHPNYGKTKVNPTYLKQMAEEYNSVAYVIIKDGQLLSENYWDGYSSSSYSNSFSAAKSIISLLIGAAIEDGLITGTDQPIGELIKEFANDERGKIPLKDLLTMSSGLEWYESYWNPFSVTAKAYYGNDIVNVALNRNYEEPSGIHWSYKSGDTQLLGIILNRVTGKSVSQYAAEKFWIPIGAKHEALWSIDRANGMEKAYCCFNTNAPDFARLGQLVLNKGNWKGKQLIPEWYIEEATAPATSLKTPDDETVNWYGYQFWLLEHKGEPIHYFRGILGQYVFVIPGKNAVVVRLGHERSSTRENNMPIDIPMYLDAAWELI